MGTKTTNAPTTTTPSCNSSCRAKPKLATHVGLKRPDVEQRDVSEQGREARRRLEVTLAEVPIVGDLFPQERHGLRRVEAYLERGVLREHQLI